MKLRGRIARRDSGVADRAWPQRDARTESSIPVLVIERQDAIGGVMRCSYPKSAENAVGRCVSVEIERMIRSGSCLDGSSPFGGWATREDLNDSCYRVRPVEHAGGAAHDLNPVEVVGGEMAEIEKPSRRVNGHAVDQDLGVATFASAQEKRSHGPVRSTLHDRSTGYFAQRIGNSSDPARPKIVTGDYGYRLSQRIRWTRHLRT